MAKKKEQSTSTRKSIDPKNLLKDFHNSYDYYEPIRKDWSDREAILLGRRRDSLRGVTKSQIHDPALGTIAIERMKRVMAQLSTGKVSAPLAHKGKANLMDMVLHEYIEPNANSQWNLLTKLKLIDLYSGVYGTMTGLVDYVVRDDYIGPDVYLIPARYSIPQAGRVSVQDCDYYYVGSEITFDWLSKQDKNKWTNIDKLEEKLKAGGGKVKDSDHKTYSEKLFNDNGANESNWKFKKLFAVTRYEKDRWVTLLPDYDIAIRDRDNPHGNGKIPVVAKYAMPLIDRFHGLGDIERGTTLQYAIDSIWNLFLDAGKFSIYPPRLVQLNKIASRASIKDVPGANWYVKSVDAITPYPIRADNINNFQATYPALKSALLNMAGTTDTTVASSVDPSMGRTPQALALLSQRQNSADEFDREMMEQFISETYDFFIDLMTKKQVKPIELKPFAVEIDTFIKNYPDVAEMLVENDGKVIIKPEDISDTRYKYFIDSGSTFKRDQVIEKQEITEHLSLALKIGDPMEIKQTGKIRLGETVIDVGELFKRSIMTSGMLDPEKIVREEPVEEQVQNLEQPNGMAPNPTPDGAIPPQMMGGGQMPPMPQQMPQGGAQPQMRGDGNGDILNDEDIRKLAQELSM